MMPHSRGLQLDMTALGQPTATMIQTCILYSTRRCEKDTKLKRKCKKEQAKRG